MYPFQNRLRRLIAAGAVLMLFLTACTSAPAETTAPPKPAAAETTAPQTETSAPEHIPTEPVITEPVVTEPPETTAPRIDYDDLVKDANCFVYFDSTGDEYCYHIPMVDLASCDAVNDGIYRDISGVIDTQVRQAVGQYDYPDCWRILYFSGHRDEIVSITVAAADMDTDQADYYTYYVSARTGEQVGQTQLLKAFGLSDQDFQYGVYDVLDTFLDGLFDSGAFGDGSDYSWMRMQTLSDENLRDAVPFIYSDGRLYFIATAYVPAGGGIMRSMFDFETGQMLYAYECTADHSSASTISVGISSSGSGLDYFIENCDRQYFSVDDISGFSDEELVYARNAVYAKSGRIFSTQKIASFFQSCDWYVPRYTAEEFSDDMLNEYQLANRNLIVGYENRITVQTQPELEYFIENCDRRYFTAADLQGFDKQMCLYARNAIFAKSGWIFSSPDLSGFFQGYSWYTPRYTADEFSDDYLNEYQKANRDLILEYEAGL